MKKDKTTSVRVNSDVMAMLEKNGWTIQRLVDWAIDQKIVVATKIKLKK